ncbi:MAG TPA: glycosyltransferase family 2 protein [Stellaceae bacterium]|nr:glycosyltransferase family 2 protein [Stellaceae bacterium]
MIRPTVSVLIPCYNEEITIAKVVTDFRRALPDARVYVYDNNSTDGTCAAARAAGALVRHERRQGKGNVVRRMFADINSDIYVLVDGDDTYDASAAPGMIELLLADRLDFVNAKRVEDSLLAYRAGHRLGNRVLTGFIAFAFGATFEDMLSGYMLFSRRFVKSFPMLAKGFEIETELTVHALELALPSAEVATNYKERPSGSFSKLSTYRDGIRILVAIITLIKDERPLAFFSVAAAVFALAAIFLGAPVAVTYFEIGLVPRLPTAVLAMGLMIVAVLSLMCGLILDTVSHGRREMKRLHYLAQPCIDES